jgi:hypothetical protein
LTSGASKEALLLPRSDISSPSITTLPGIAIFVSEFFFVRTLRMKTSSLVSNAMSTLSPGSGIIRQPSAFCADKTAPYSVNTWYLPSATAVMVPQPNSTDSLNVFLLSGVIFPIFHLFIKILW